MKRPNISFELTLKKEKHMFKDRLFYRRVKFFVLLLVIALLAVVLVSPVRAQPPDLQISDVQIEPVQVEAGKPAMVRFILNNVGEGLASNVWVMVTLPQEFALAATGIKPETELQSVIPDWAVSWAFPQIEPNQPIRFELPVQVNAGVSIGDFEIKVFHKSDEQPDGVETAIPVTISAGVVPPSLPVLQIVEARMEPDTVEAGQIAIVRFTLNNTGDGLASNAQVAVILPQEFALAATGIKPEVGLYPVTSGEPVDWVFPQIEPNQLIIFELPVQVNIDVVAGDFEIKVFHKSDEQPDRAETSILVTILAGVVPSPPVLQIVEARMEPDTVEAGKPAMVRLILNNAGEGLASNVWVTVALPQGLVPIAEGIQPPLTQLPPLTLPVVWNFPEFSAGHSEAIVLPVQAQSDMQAGLFDIQVSFVSDEQSEIAPVTIQGTIKPSIGIPWFFGSVEIILVAVAAIIAITAGAVMIFPRKSEPVAKPATPQPETEVGPPVRSQPSLSSAQSPIPSISSPSQTTCPNCGFDARSGARFCPACGTVINLVGGRYQILRCLGQGGMGSVYLVEDNRIVGKQWALKQTSDKALTTPDERQQAIDAFQREAKLLATLDHPNLPRVIDFFSESDRHYLVMDYIEGDNLGELLAHQAKPLLEAKVLNWAGQLCDVLSYLHVHQPPIIFRDLKPDNIMVAQNGRLKLIDFGIVRFFKPGQLTDTVSFGTPGFAAPEQYGKGQTDARSDVYALGVTLHQLLTGHDPALSPFVLPPARQLNPVISLRMEAVITQATQVDPAQRYRTVLEVKQDLGIG